ncbi:MAG: ABC transporter ATP-binding protein, partial [Chitinophagaceae bacterium]
ASYVALRDVLTQALRRREKRNAERTFWALNDINLQIEQGERIGIIGRNGAGKSTLLKIISRITPPTKGRVVLEGRVASLLEVGTGFHPELTGRENIYLNGSILGLKKTEINAKLDEIIAFSGVESFIDTALKHYSSGMQLRLAFSVAAHLEPEILLIDEVLAVGDIEFQKKCLGKMEEVSRENGRTILFVSHNLEAVLKFCNRTITWTKETAPGNEKLRLLSVFVHNADGDSKANYFITEPVGVSFQYEVLEPGLAFTHGVNVFNEQGLNIFDSHDNYTEVGKSKREPGLYAATVWIPANLLTDGYFSVGIALFSQQPFHIFIHQLHVVSFTVVDELTNESARGEYAGDYGGIVRPKLNWEAKKLQDV